MAARITTRIRRAVLRLTDVRTKRFWVMFVVFGPVAYVLSTGPFLWLLLNGYIDVDSPTYTLLSEVVYGPLNWLALRNDTAGQWLGWYINLWIPFTLERFAA